MLLVVLVVPALLPLLMAVLLLLLCRRAWRLGSIYPTRNSPEPVEAAREVAVSNEPKLDDVEEIEPTEISG